MALLETLPAKPESMQRDPSHRTATAKAKLLTYTMCAHNVPAKDTTEPTDVQCTRTKSRQNLAHPRAGVGVDPGSSARAKTVARGSKSFGFGLETATTATTLPAGAVSRDRGNIFNAADLKWIGDKECEIGGGGEGLEGKQTHRTGT